MELTLDQALQKGIEAHKAGKAQEADRYYTAILKANPKHPDANHNMGVLAVGIGKVQEALPFFKTALEANDSIAQYWLSYIDALIKIDQIGDAKAALDQAKSKGANGDGFDQLEQRIKLGPSKNSNSQDPSQEELDNLINLYTQRQYQETLTQALKLLEKFPRSFTLYNIVGVTNHISGKAKEAVRAYKKAISIKPDFAEAHNNLGITLKDQGKLDEALEVYNNAISIKPDYAEAFNNMGVALQDNRETGRALEAYEKAISLNSNYAEAHNNIGNAFQDTGKLKEARQAYNTALSIKPDFCETHRNLSSITKYTAKNQHFVSVKNLYKKNYIIGKNKCNLDFTLFKMYEDIGELEKAFEHLKNGNLYLKNLLKYTINSDKFLFGRLKEAQPHLLKKSLKVQMNSTSPTPVFILGMPRSGTTLVEQIISLHSKVTDAGELNYLAQDGTSVAANEKNLTSEAIIKFREQYLSKVKLLSSGSHYVTDKMPSNFRFVPLICASFPEARIIHVERDGAATCWSNYKQYFSTKDLGYSYDLNDLVAYYRLYDDLMSLWKLKYGKRIYTLNYEKLTTDQKSETMKLIDHLGLDWEKACLSPQNNPRTVKTASQQQVRQKVYQGSSEAWRKYEPFLMGAFDSLPSS